MKKIGISTVFTGFNYGSCLQAYATRIIVTELGYTPISISMKGSIIKGRDFRITKLLAILKKAILYREETKGKIAQFKKSYDKKYTNSTKEKFSNFIDKEISPTYYSWRELTSEAKSNSFIAFLCGSDQIWSGHALYVDPQYYLRFAPKYKRIAFAPSFGANSVATSNKELIQKYISDIEFISARESSGVDIIKNLVGRDAVQLVDPTIILDSQAWDLHLKISNSSPLPYKYVLAYFLDKPSELACQMISELRCKYPNLKIVSLPFEREKSDWFDELYDAGPIDFITLIKHAEYVLTDSFHGTVFSVLYHKQFYTFSRNYGLGENQSTRVVSLVQLLKLEDRFNPDVYMINQAIDYQYTDRIILEQRSKSLNYLMSTLAVVERGKQ